MQHASIVRLLEWNRIEDERGSLCDGMSMLIRVFGHLKADPIENAGAMNLVCSVIGRMEDENKALSEKAGQLLQAVIAVDGLEMSSAEIDRECVEVATGIRWLARACTHVAQTWGAEEGRDEICMQIAKLRNDLAYRQSQLQNCQTEYQEIMAEILVRSAHDDPSKTIA